MSVCPTVEVLRALLGDSLPQNTAEQVRTHVDTCPECQRQLDRLGGDQELDRVGPVTTLAGETPREAVLQHLLDGPRIPPQTGPAARPTTIGPYRIEAELGRGGMGIVYQAYDPALDRRVALKVLRPELAHAEGRARFLREARGAAQLRHENVVRVHAVADPPDDLPYFVMEFVSGPTLAELVRTRGKLDVREAAGFAAAVADGLAAAHAAGLIHRDVKPANVLIDSSGGVPKLADFGLVKRLDEAGQTHAGAILGTPSYLAPEQVEAKVGPISMATDVHGLGALLYELLTGRPPFLGVGLTETLLQVLTEEPIPVRRLRPEVPRDLETICARALAKAPGRRYASAAAMAADLRHWLAGEPIAARPAGTLERFWLRCRRHPRVTLLTATALLLLLILAIGGPLAAWHIARARQSAEIERNHFAEALFLTVVEIPQRFDQQPETLAIRRDLLAGGRHLIEEMEPGPGHDYFRCLVHLGEGSLHQRDLRIAAARDEFTRALDLTRTLTAAHPERESYWRCRYVAHSRLGDLDDLSQNPTGADDHYSQALEALSVSFTLRPPKARDHRERSLCENKLGRVALLRGDAVAARQRFTSSLDALDRYAEAGPEDAEQVSADRRFTFGQLGEAWIAANDLDAAADAFQRSLTEARALVKADPTDPHRKHQLASTRERIGGLQLRRYAFADADAAYREAVALRKALAERDVSGETRRNYAVALSLLGDSQQRQEHPDSARTAYRASLEILEALATEGRAVVLVRNSVLIACAKLAEVEVSAGQFDAAARWKERADGHLRAWEKTGPLEPTLVLTRAGIAEELRIYAAAAESLQNLDAALAREPNLVGPVLELHGLTLARRGDHVQAAACAKRLTDRFPTNPYRQLGAARIYARCAADNRIEPTQRSGYVSAAVSALAATLEHAGVGAPAVLQGLYRVSEFDAIRSEEAFRSLIKKWKTP